MTRYVIRRLLQAVVLVFASATIVAVFIHLIPGDPVTSILGEDITPERAEAVREELGLNRPIYVQYGEWISGAARGDFGNSVTSGRPIRNDLMRRLPRTLELIALSTILSVAIGIPAGVIAAPAGKASCAARSCGQSAPEDDARRGAAVRHPGEGIHRPRALDFARRRGGSVGSRGGVLLFPRVLIPCLRLKGRTGHHSGRRGHVQVCLDALPQGMALFPR
jgi:hypothetical protein